MKEMDTNPCYKLTDTLYEEIRQGDGSTIKQSSTEGSQTFARGKSANVISTKRRKTTKRCFVGIIAAVVFISTLSLSLVAVIVPVHLQIGNLQNKIETLEQQLNQTENVGLQPKTTQLSSLQSSVNTLNTDRDTTMAQLNSLQSSVDTLNNDRDTTMAQLNSLQSSVDTLNNDRDTTMDQLNSLQTVVNGLNTVQHSTTSQLSSLQSSVGTLTTRVNSPVNLHQNCIDETTNCTILLDVNYSFYWTYCTTNYLNIDSGVSFNMIWLYRLCTLPGG